MDNIPFYLLEKLGPQLLFDVLMIGAMMLYTWKMTNGLIQPLLKFLDHNTSTLNKVVDSVDDLRDMIYRMGWEKTPANYAELSRKGKGN